MGCSRSAGRWGRRLLVVALATESGAVAAAGFAIREQSTTGQGTAFAGATAAAHDLTDLFFNPAALGRLRAPAEIAVAASLIKPRLEVQQASAGTALGTPVGGSGAGIEAGEAVAVPALYAGLRLHERWALGVGVNAPFGLGTDYPRAWAGRYYTLETDLRTVNVNPVVAWTPWPWLTLAGGPQLAYADASISNAIDFGSIGAALGLAGSVPARQDGLGRVKGDDWAVGYTLGVLAGPVARTRIGVGFRSELDHELAGDADFALGSSGTGAAVAAATGAFRDTGARAGLRTPATLSVGLAHGLDDRITLMAEVAWTDWSVFDELRVRYANPAQPDTVSAENWHDTWFAALGASLRWSDELVLRGGLAFDQGATTDAHRSPRVPDGDRYWASVGLSWQAWPGAALDLAYTHIFFEDVGVRRDRVDPANPFRGTLRADYESSIDIVSLGIRVRF